MSDDEIETEDFAEDTETGEKLLEVCPVCGSQDLYYEAGGVEGMYHCKHCGYIGAFVIDANKEMMELIQKEYESVPKNED